MTASPRRLIYTKKDWIYQEEGSNPGYGGPMHVLHCSTVSILQLAASWLDLWLTPVTDPTIDCCTRLVSVQILGGMLHHSHTGLVPPLSSGSLGTNCVCISNYMVQRWSIWRLSCDILVVNPMGLVVAWSLVLSVVSFKQMEGHLWMPTVQLLSVVMSDPLGGHRTYIQLLAIPVCSLTSNRCVSPVSGGTPFNVVSEPLLMHKLATSCFPPSACTFATSRCHPAEAMQGTNPEFRTLHTTATP